MAIRPPSVGDGKEVADVSYGKMATPIQIVTTGQTKDADGFAVKGDIVLASVRAYFEPKNSTEKWRNNAAFAEATALFRFRIIPDVTVDTAMFILCGGERYNIISVENVRGRGMYIESFAKAVSGSG